MARETPVEWCDSTTNPSMGCNGCELWNRAAGVKKCYAGTMTDRYSGSNTGFPAVFEEPKLFPGRIADAAKWKDLTGTERPNKPWLNGMPRLIFVGDMGDSLTEDLPIDWLRVELEIMAGSPHQWLILTKRPKRMAELSRLVGGLPSNVWPGTSVTSQKTASRAVDLIAVEGGGPKFLSCEPLLGEVSLVSIDTGQYRINFNVLDGSYFMLMSDGGGGIVQEPNRHISWVICGGESGSGSSAMNPAWAKRLRNQCVFAEVPFFFKQWGEWCYPEQMPDETYNRHNFAGGVEYDQPHKVGKKAAGRMLDGIEWNQMPALSS